MDKQTRNLKINTIDALATSINLYRANDHQILRGNGQDLGTKDVIISYFLGKSSIKLTENDYSTAQELRDYLIQKITLNHLSGNKINSFVQTIVDLIQKDQINIKQLGILVWAPKMYEESLAIDSLKENLSFLALTSRYIGREDEKVELEFHPLRVKYLINYDMFAHDGHDEKNNIVTFLNKKKIDTVTTIRGKVKAHKKSPNHANGQTTILNYVKILGNQ